VKKLIECVPNFSEGRDESSIRQIADAIQSVEGVRLLNVDPGKAANRTVFTFIGEPEGVIESAFRGAKTAARLIDMRRHTGEHPRMGAIDVCPLIPIAHISMDETVDYARRLARRMGEELGLPVYCYEFAAFFENRRSLANCRSGEYEGLKEKLQLPAWKPDFGPDVLNEQSGASVVGARNFLVAYNVNLDTTSVSLANAIAGEVRESGRVVRDTCGKSVRVPGSLKKVRAIGWFIKEYGKAQVSMNLTDLAETSVYQAFDEVSARACQHGIHVTGSELIGLVPLQVMLDAGKHYLLKQHRSINISEEEIIDIAVKSLGLDELGPFDSQKRILEYLIENQDYNHW
jgi:glutamate formiminotransferase / formiminotetrahydrofolate cyclodeaminase